MAVIPKDGQLNRITAKKKIERHGKIRVVITIILAIILILLLWGAVYTNADVNSYKIVVDGKRDGTLSLSFDSGFAEGTGFSVLKGLGVRNTEIAQGVSYTDGIDQYAEKVANGEVPMDIQMNGQAGKATAYNSDEFIASKFYLKNLADIGADSIKYKMRINVLENSKNALSAARFLIVSDTDGTPSKTVYAQPNSENGQEKVATKFRGSESYVADPVNPTTDWLCVSLKQTENGQWYYDSQEMDNVVFELTPQQVRGYCVCVWYEGSDPDHSDKIKGGYFTFNVSFRIAD